MADMPTTARPRSNAARILTILGFVFAVLALLLNPIIFGVLGVIAGIVGAVLGDKPLGWYAAAASAVAAVVGLVIVAALLNN
jgi:membrane protein implicated in regulation of membrane protease activity